MFEKYDGVRGFWNPLKKAFYSRKGNRFTIPQRIVDSMPSDIFLDGELWYVHANMTSLRSEPSEPFPSFSQVRA